MTRDKILGCLVAGAIGDAIGSNFEGSPPSCIETINPFSLDWQISDDTQLTLATCEAIIQYGLKPEFVADSLLRWYRDRRIRRVGSSTLKAFRDLDAGCHWALSGRKGEFAAGNGAAIRIAPLAFCSEVDSPKGRQMVRDVSRITHQSEEAFSGALATVLAIAHSGQGTVEPLLENYRPTPGLRGERSASTAQWQSKINDPRSRSAGGHFGICG